MMREVMELTTEEICKALAITPTNLWVMLHRASEPARMPRNQMVWRRGEINESP